MPGFLSCWFTIQRSLFPALEDELGPLSDTEARFVRVVALLDIGPWMLPFRWKFTGRKPEDRHAILKAFLAKAVWNFPTTRALLDYLHSAPSLRRLCGWDRAADIPSEATFSRAFAAFASGELPQQLHAALIHTHLGPKLIGHISRDATAIPAREHPAPKPPPPPPAPNKKRGRPAKDDPPRPPKPPTRVMLQPTRSLAENLADLPTACTVGCKRNSQGYQESWTGYKLHLDCADGDIPVSAILTSASLHDSQVAIPLAQLTAGRVHNLYDLADSAYDVPQILAFSHSLGHVPLIDPHPRRADALPFDPASTIRFRERSTVERVNSNLKDNVGGLVVRVRGHVNVLAHLMFGLLALTATQLFNLLL